MALLWNLRVLDTLLVDGATVLSFQFVRAGKIEEPALEAGLTEDECHGRERALAHRILERAAEDLEKLATLKVVQGMLIDKRFAAKTAAEPPPAPGAAAGADPPSGAASEA